MFRISYLWLLSMRYILCVFVDGALRNAIQNVMELMLYGVWKQQFRVLVTHNNGIKSILNKNQQLQII